VSSPVTRSLLASADHFPRPSDSTSSVCFPELARLSSSSPSSKRLVLHGVGEGYTKGKERKENVAEDMVGRSNSAYGFRNLESHGPCMFL
jgi:hypothetical protein